MVLRDEVSQSRTMGHGQALEELREAGDLFVWSVSLVEQCMSERRLSVPAGEGD